MSLTLLESRLNRTLPDARIEPVTLPGCAGITLGLINADYQTGPLDPDIMAAAIRSPAYWAFCWGSGLALARFLLTEPRWVNEKTIVDLGAGSGVVAIAAALAGARRVIACDTDADALLATAANAALNGVTVELSDTLPPRCDVLLMADVLYDRQNLPLLNTAQACAVEVLVADSRVTTLPDPSYREIARIKALTLPNLGEFDEFGTAHVFHWQRRQPERSSSIASAS
jgi:predicted nicotinamide N-methyase